MKKLLLYILVLIVIVGLFSPLTHVNAQSAPAAPTSLFGAAYDGLNWLTGGILNFPKPADLVTGILQVISIAILKLMSWITWLAGYFLNFVLDYTVVNMKLHISGDGTPANLGLTGINIAWKIIRDLMNIAFIFLLVYEGIRLIIGLGNLQSIKKFIGMIVLASLLINFSLFFTKVLIDASNIVTIRFYNSIIATPAGVISKEGVGLSDKIANTLGVTSLYDSGKDGNANPDFGAQKGPGGILIMLLGSGLVLLVSAFVFFAVAILFVIRYVTLIILLMLSPIAYMGMALPFMEKYAKDWWESFKGQLLFAPIYMLMTWVVLTLMASPGFVTATKFTEILNNNGAQPAFSKMGLLLNFAVVIGLLIASLIIAKDTAKRGSILIGQATGKLTAFAGGVVMGGAARLGRNTVGRAGQVVANNQWLRERAPDSRVARTLIKTGEKTGSASMDVRATGLGKNMEMGKAGGKGGFQAAREDKIKERMQFADKMNDVVTGDNIENEMSNRRWNSVTDYNFLQNTVGLTGAQIAAINAGGASKNQIETLEINARQAEHMRRRVHTDLNTASIQENANRRDRYLHNLSQTHWYTPNLYSGVSEDAESAERMRSGKKAKKGGKDKLWADLAAALKEEEPETTPTAGTPPTPAPPPAPAPPVPPPAGTP